MAEPTPTPGFNGCPWTIDASCAQDEWDNYSAAVQERATALASATLHRLSGYRVGGCPVTLRPCKPACAENSIYPPHPGPFQPHSFDGRWFNSCFCRTRDCACSSLSEIPLPAPVGAVYEVLIDGTALDPSNYQVDGNRLVYTGPEDNPFPACQDMAADITEEGTFAVRYLNAYEPDGLAAAAAGTLAVEYARACTGGKCRLPAGVTSIVRQGVSFEIEGGAFPNGFTGMREVDAWIALWNPDGLRQQSKVYSPDLRRPRYTTFRGV